MRLSVKIMFQIVREEDFIYSMERFKKEIGMESPILSFFYDRGSTPAQKASAEARKEIVLSECKKNGFIVLDYFCEMVNGRSDRIGERHKLLQAILGAGKLDAVLIVLSTSRLIRAADKKQDAPLRNCDLTLLRRLLGSVRVVSLIPPGTPKEKVRGIISKMGQQGKRNRGGRPKKKIPGELELTREKYTPIAIKMKLKKKYSYREISKILFKKYNVEIAHTNIHRWVVNALRKKE